MRLLVCGGRAFSDKQLLVDYLDCIRQTYGPITVLINGKAPGADLLAADWAVDNGIPVEYYPANWKEEGIIAGPLRNQRMLDRGKPDLLVAFPGNRGTADMVARARRAVVKVFEVKGVKGA